MLEDFFHKSFHHFVFTQKSVGEELTEYDYIMRLYFHVHTGISLYIITPSPHKERCRLQTRLALLSKCSFQ